MADDEAGKGGSIFQFEPAEIIRAAIATLIVLVVRVALAAIKLTPGVPGPLKGVIAPEQLTTAIAGVLWLAILLVIFGWKRFRNRRKHVQGKVQPGKISIHVAELESDGKKGEHRTNIVETLRRELGTSVRILRAGIELCSDEAGDAADEASAANRKAQSYLGRQKGDLLIWGRVMEGPPVVIELRFTSPAHDGAEEMRFNYDQKFLLTEEFGQELGAALAAVAAQQARPALDEGKYVADVLTPVAEKLAKLAESLPSSMVPEQRGWLLHSYALIENRVGLQCGDSSATERAAKACARVLNEWRRERVPFQWAVAQFNLGAVLATIGSRGSSTAPLERAAVAYRAALEEWTRERFPVEWAMAQSNLGNALVTIGSREGSKLRLEQAAQALREALKEHTRDRVPLRWAYAQSNLGYTLGILGSREPGTVRLEEAVAAHRSALEEWTRERVPLKWANAQNNLGIALKQLGSREPGTARLEEAVAAHRFALEEWTRERVPLDWGATQNNLGSVLRLLGERETGTGLLEEAIETLRLAGTELTRERVPLQWAKVQTNLGIAFDALGSRERSAPRLEAAVGFYRAALEENSRVRDPLEWAKNQDSLGVALCKLGWLENSMTHFEDAANAHRAALEENTQLRVPLEWASAQNNLGVAFESMGNLVEAAEAFRRALLESSPEAYPQQNANVARNLERVLGRLSASESSENP